MSCSKILRSGLALAFISAIHVVSSKTAETRSSSVSTRMASLDLNAVSPAFPERFLSDDYGYMHFDRCLRTKIVENNDDDGNSYFYNGAYRSQSMLFIAYRLCKDCGCSDGGKSFIMPAADVLEDQVTYAKNYCDACSNQCGQRRRRTEDGQEGGQYQADCNTCVDQCSPLLQNYFEGYDETEYLQCQEAYADEDGVQYYSGPACDSKGLLTIGLFYDEDCTVKKDSSNDSSGGYGENFSRNTFFSMEEMCISCESSGLCDVMEQGYQCEKGRNVNENIDDEMNVCKTYKKVTKEWTYASPKTNYHVALFMCAFLLAFMFCFGSYTYYVRHKRAAEKALNDSIPPTNDQSPSAKAEYAEMT